MYAAPAESVAARVWPSGLNAMPMRLWPVGSDSSATNLWVATLKKMTLPSVVATATYLPFGVNATSW